MSALTALLVAATATCSSGQDDGVASAERSSGSGKGFPLVCCGSDEACVAAYAGKYSGTYDGSFEGTWSLDIGSDGRMAGEGHRDDGSFVFDISGIVGRDGHFTVTGDSIDLTFFGRILADGTLSGNWQGEGGAGGIDGGRVEGALDAPPCEGSDATVDGGSSSARGGAGGGPPTAGSCDLYETVASTDCEACAPLRDTCESEGCQAYACCWGDCPAIGGASCADACAAEHPGSAAFLALVDCSLGTCPAPPIVGEPAPTSIPTTVPTAPLPPPPGDGGLLVPSLECAPPTTQVTSCAGQACPVLSGVAESTCVVTCCAPSGGTEVCGIQNTSTLFGAESCVVPDPRCPAPSPLAGAMAGCCLADGRCGLDMGLGCTSYDSLSFLTPPVERCDGATP